MSLGLSLPLLLRLFGCLCLHYPISDKVLDQMSAKGKKSSASREIKNTPSKREKNRAMQKEKNGAQEGKKK